MKSNVSDLLLVYICYTKATQMWFHAAHHLSKGKSFAGDHVLLYGKIYETLTNDLDAIIEKAISFTDRETVACPIIILSLIHI